MSRTIPVVVCLALLVSGCSSQKAVDRVKRSNDLKEIGLAFHEFCQKPGSPAPTKADDLKPWIKDTGAMSKLASGEVVFLWGVHARDLARMPDGSGGTILAYEKETPEKGGLCLFGECSVKELTAEEFKKTPKAKSQ